MLAPPPLPWIPRPWQAGNPLRAWLPRDHGAAFPEVLRGDHAAITGTASWGHGAYGRCFQGNGSSYGISGTFPAADALSITIAHLSSATDYRGLIGWGSGNQGILYRPTDLAVIDAGTSPRFTAPVGKPTTSWRILTLTLAGHASGSAAEFWVDGARASAGVLSAALTAPTQFWIGSLRLGANPWQSGIGPAYYHDRVLGAREIQVLHADLHRVVRDLYSPTARRFAAIPVPWVFSGSGTAAAPAGSGNLGYTWGVIGTGTAAAPQGASQLGHSWPLSGTGIGPAAIGAGDFDFAWIFAGLGVGGEASGQGVVSWPPPPRPDARAARWAPSAGSPDPRSSTWRPT